MKEETQILMLKAANANARLLFMNAQAHYDTVRYEEWQCNWAEGFAAVQAEFDAIIKELEARK